MATKRVSDHEWRRLARENAQLAERSMCTWGEPNDGKAWPDLVTDNNALRAAMGLPKWKKGSDVYDD